MLLRAFSDLLAPSKVPVRIGRAVRGHKEREYTVCLRHDQLQGTQFRSNLSPLPCLQLRGGMMHPEVHQITRDLEARGF